MAWNKVPEINNPYTKKHPQKEPIKRYFDSVDTPKSQEAIDKAERRRINREKHALKRKAKKERRILREEAKNPPARPRAARLAWWNSLTKEEQAAYGRKKAEQKRMQRKFKSQVLSPEEIESLRQSREDEGYSRARIRSM